MKIRHRWRVALCCVVTLALAGVLVACGAPQPEPMGGDEATTTEKTEPATADEVANSAEDASSTDEQPAADYGNPGDGYQLQQVVVLARHNIRAPLSSGGSTLAKATPNTWIDWTADPSCLTLRGGVLETLFGQYVRGWLESEQLIEPNWQPTSDQIRVYANSLERTHATAQYFVAGMLPVGDVPVETHFEFDEKDPTFIPYLTFVSDSYNEAALEQVAHMGGEKGMAGLAADLTKNFALLADVCDYTKSEGYKSGELTDLDPTDTQVTLELGKEPAMSGSFKTATQLADALVLQCYEADDAHAAFGKELTREQWEQISAIKDKYVDVLFAAPLISQNVAHPLLSEIGSELDLDGRKFTFLCGHDSDLSSVLSALSVEEYELPKAIEKKTPIGSMVAFEKWADADGNQFGRLRLIYQTADQLRDPNLLVGGQHPESFELSLSGLSKNDDGLYTYDDLRGRLQEATDAYDQIVATYSDEEQLDLAA